MGGGGKERSHGSSEKRLFHSFGEKLSLEKKRDVVLGLGAKTLGFIQGLCGQKVAVYANRKKEKNNRISNSCDIFDNEEMTEARLSGLLGNHFP